MAFVSYENLYICGLEIQNKKLTIENTMKKILIAAIALAMGFAACNNENKPVEAATGADSIATTGKIAYFYIDQVVDAYQFAKDKQAEFQKKYDDATKKLANTEKSIQRDQTNLQKKANELQEKVNKVLITQANAQAEMEKLAAEEQKINKRIANYQTEAQKVSGQLAEEEMVMTNQIMHNITEFVKGLNTDYQFDIILQSSTVGGPIINANPALDLTAVIIKGLNESYTPESK